MALYLDACLDEDPGDGGLVRATLNCTARDTGLTREGLYKALSATGNPEFSTMLKVIKALKIKLHAAPATPAKGARALARRRQGNRRRFDLLKVGVGGTVQLFRNSGHAHQTPRRTLNSRNSLIGNDESNRQTKLIGRSPTACSN